MAAPPIPEVRTQEPSLITTPGAKIIVTEEPCSAWCRMLFHDDSSTGFAAPASLWKRTGSRNSRLEQFSRNLLLVPGRTPTSTGVLSTEIVLESELYLFIEGESKGRLVTITVVDVRKNDQPDI